MDAKEFAVICGLLRAALGTDTPALSGWREHAAGMKPGRFAALVRRHRVGAFLAKRLPDDVRLLLPKECMAALTTIAAEGARAALARAGELVRLIRACTEAGLPVIGVKGVVLAQKLYGNVAHRHSGDIDLVFPLEQVGAADAVLKACGYRRTRPDFELTPRQHREYLLLKPEFEYWSADTQIRVELHWRLEGVEAAEAWREATVLRLGGCEVRTLGDDLNMRYLCEHGARHGWFRLFWLVDIALLMESGRLDWARIRADARLAGTARAPAQAVELATRLLGVLPPAMPQEEASEESRVVAGLVGEACRMMALPEAAASGLVEWARQLRYRMALSNTTTGKWHALKPHLYSPLGWPMLRLPDRWFWLYAPLTPLLWLLRRMQPRRQRRRAIT